MNQTEIEKLASEWDKLLREAERERLHGSERIAQSLENSAARIEEKLWRHDIDPRDYLKD